MTFDVDTPEYQKLASKLAGAYQSYKDALAALQSYKDATLRDAATFADGLTWPDGDSVVFFTERPIL